MLKPTATREETQQPLAVRDSTNELPPILCLRHNAAITVYAYSRDGTCPVCVEHERLANRATTTTVYHETEATRKKLEANAETIRCLKASIDVHLNTIRDRTALVLSYESSIESQAKTDRILRAKIEELRDMVGPLEEEAKATDIRLRERDWLIETYREKFDVMTERIEELTPDCEVCGGNPSTLVCETCKGVGRGCQTCGGSGGVKKCRECGKETHNAR